MSFSGFFSRLPLNFNSDVWCLKCLFYLPSDIIIELFARSRSLFFSMICLIILNIVLIHASHSMTDKACRMIIKYSNLVPKFNPL